MPSRPELPESRHGRRPPEHASGEGRGSRDEENQLPSGAISLMIQVTLLLGGLAVYLLVSDWNSGTEDGYAFVIGIHLGLLAAGALIASLYLIVKRRNRDH